VLLGIADISEAAAELIERERQADRLADSQIGES
jgi:hypothetical protein